MLMVVQDPRVGATILDKITVSTIEQLRLDDGLEKFSCQDSTQIRMRSKAKFVIIMCPLGC